MKKKTLLSVLLCLGGLLNVNAQQSEHEFEIISGPEYIEPINKAGASVKGVSESGKYCWGNNTTNAYYYNIETGEFCIIGITEEEKYQGYSTTTIAGVTDDGKVLVNYGHRKCYLLDTATGDTTFIESPLKDYPYVYIWEMTPDAKYLAGNFITQGNGLYPMCAIRQDDGSYKTIPLEHDSLDAMGAVAKFTQVRIITDDGKYIGGSQNDCTGSVARYVIWRLDENGNYVKYTPFDDILFDFTVEKPGEAPDFDDYVTATDHKSEEYKKQKEEYNKIRNVWLDKFEKFTRNETSNDWTALCSSASGDVLCGTVRYTDPETYEVTNYPAFYDFENDSITIIKDIAGSKGKDFISNNRFLSIGGPANYPFQILITDNGKSSEFSEWLFDKTGTNLKDSYYVSFMDKMSWTKVEGVFMGLPNFSKDGRTMVLITPEKGRYTASVIKFNHSIFGDVETGIEAEVVNNFEILGSVIEGNAEVNVYTLDGKMVKTVKVDGRVDMNDILTAGAYLIKVTRDDNITKSFKLVVF